VIDLYAAPTSNGLRATVILEETGLPFKLHPIDLMKGEHKKPEFLAKNPFGQIPCLVDSDGPGGKPLTLAQSAAIMLYVCQKAGKFLPADPAKRAAIDGAMYNASADMGGTLGAIFTIARSATPHKPSQELFEVRWKGYMDAWNGILGASKYVIGNELTVADFALYCTLARAKGVLPALVQGWANIDRWMGEIGARPATQKGMKFQV
jgi:GST-like protein